MKLFFLVLLLSVFSALPALANTCTSPCLVAQSTTATTTALNTTGATIFVIVCGHRSAPCVAPTSSPANTFTGLTNYIEGDNELSIWYKCGPTTSSTQTFSSGQAGDTIAFAAYSGTATSSCFDSGQDVGTTTTLITATTTITPSAASAGYLVVSAISNYVNETPTVADNQGNTIVVATNLQNAGVTQSAWQAYRNYNSTSAIDISWTFVQDYGASASAGFKGPSASTYVPNVSVISVGP